MTEIRFYHLQKQPIEQALPVILEKALEKGHRIILKCANDDDMAYLDKHLWTYKQNSFLPHGTSKDDFKDGHPVYLTCNDDNPNDADVIFLTGGATCEDPQSYALCCDMFNGNIAEELQAARGRWKAASDKGLEVTYWQQSETGSWDKKA